MALLLECSAIMTLHLKDKSPLFKPTEQLVPLMLADKRVIQQINKVLIPRVMVAFKLTQGSIQLRSNCQATSHPPMDDLSQSAKAV